MDSSISFNYMRILFTVQGEGRGHMTQALAVRQMLPRLGHELIGVVIGRQSNRALPEYVTEGLAAPIVELPSPGFALRQSKGVDIPKTVWRAVTDHRVWRESADRLRALVLDA